MEQVRRDARRARASGEAHGLDRVLAFGDAVVAIAITLVVLPVVDRALDAGSAREFFAESWGTLAPAGISFVVIALFWRVHHWLFLPATGYSGTVLQLEMLWLASIVALPVATVLDFTSGGGDRLALGVYIGLMLVSSLTLRAERAVLVHQGFLDDDPTETVVDRWVGAVLLAVALVLAVLFPDQGAAWLLVLLLERPIRAVGGRRRQPAAPSPSSGGT
ncbi:TMEM175 family protein [Cellulosimicrobium sp. CUA-896]|uniref:TMEM175 family protein n=1 Tax=Cellulosimicrobium sp. CUA-896 TaxID=1517881 RepID=UPI00095DAD14|nr:TMEM175 family protein [Cellulosimicrobium sp. CUA-896]OLT55308.1 hypothetical protein BJF88_06635 [Cellulosimicrobium sp. CUA-896]